MQRNINIIRLCVICNTEYKPTTYGQKTCSKKCARINKTKVARKRAIKLGLNTGLPFGEAQRGKNHHNYKHGLGMLSARLSKSIKKKRRYCNRCDKDLLEATHYFWVIHHKDHNKYNNPVDESNWELLCKCCHNKEHHSKNDLY